MHIPADLAGRLFRRALLSQRAALAIELARSIGHSPIFGHSARRLEDLAAWTEIDVTLLVEAEVGARKGAVVSLAFVPDWDMRRDPLAHQLAQKLAGSISHVGNQAFGLETETRLVRRIIVRVAATSS